MVKHKYILQWLLTIPIILGMSVHIDAQFEENFNDGELTQPNQWMGDIEQFTVNNEGQLQLNASSAGEAFLYLPVHFPDSATWNMNWLMDFAPSSANYLRIYLQLDTPTYAAGSGYFIEIGENGSDDRISLYRLEEGAETLLTELSEGAQGENPAQAYFEAERTPDGQWTLKANYSGIPLPEDQRSTSDSNPILNDEGYFGILCSYTSQRVDRFYFDDIALREKSPDTQAPQWQSYEITDSKNMRITFDEVIDSIDRASIELLPDIGSPNASSVLPGQPNVISLTFPKEFQSGTDYTLILEGIFDESSNEIQRDSILFKYIVPVEAEAYDLLVHEVMFEPQEDQVLPDAEYIELYNTTHSYVTLDGIRLADASNETILPQHQLPPHSFIILTDEDAVNQFTSYGSALGVPSMPALNNDGDQVRLKSITGDIIHEVSFDGDTYRDPSKDGAGWSIEMINPLDPCAGASNWRASNDPKHGTPGAENSVFDTTSDLEPLELIQIFPESTGSIVLHWNKGLDPNSSSDVTLYDIQPNQSIVSVSLSEDRKKAYLSIEPGLTQGNHYTLTIKPQLTDCAGQSLTAAISQVFGIPDQPQTGDVVINEVLFDPHTGGDPFVELLNTTGQFIDFSHLYLTYGDEDGIEDMLFPQSFSAEPESAIVLTSSSSDIISRYFVPEPQWLFEVDFPSTDDDNGMFRLYLDRDSALIKLDSARYASTYHAPFLDDSEGVSLERLQASVDGFASDNWYSAAETSGYATPTGLNSQSFASNKSLENAFQLASKTISPDGDGFEDQLILEYALDRSGYKATIDIYDRNGYLIRHWIKNRSLGTDGFLRWNGADDRGEKAHMGLYVIRIELWHPDGDREVMKKVCVVASKFD